MVTFSQYPVEVSVPRPGGFRRHEPLHCNPQDFRLAEPEREAQLLNKIFVLDGQTDILLGLVLLVGTGKKLAFPRQLDDAADRRQLEFLQGQADCFAHAPRVVPEILVHADPEAAMEVDGTPHRDSVLEQVGRCLSFHNVQRLFPPLRFPVFF